MNAVISNPLFALRLMEIMAAVSVSISSLEYLARPRQFGLGGLLCWEISRERALGVSASRWAMWLDSVFLYPSVLWVIGARLLSAVLLLIPRVPDAIRLTCCILVFLLSAFLMFRTHFGNDGADQMALLIFGALCLARIGGSMLTAQIALAFVAGQATLSYVTSGGAKLFVKKWHNGEHLAGVFRTASYGNRWLGRFLQEHRVFSRVSANLVITGECSFPMVFVVPLPFSLPWILGSFIFHLNAAVLMGLNTFFWSFSAAYPAVLYWSVHSASAVHGWLLH